VINEAQVRQMSQAERSELARLLAELDYPHPLLDLTPDRRTRLAAIFMTVICVILVGWIIVLALTLHQHFTAVHWRLAWVGFDMVELAAFALTAWAFWRGRQIAIALLLITATLLCCDAWFDVVLGLSKRGELFSIGSAVLIELPLAFLMLNAARRLIRMSALAAVGAGGVTLPLPSLWKLPLGSLATVAGQAAEQAGQVAGQVTGQVTQRVGGGQDHGDASHGDKTGGPGGVTPTR
jgi:hypothetical protein